MNRKKKNKYISWRVRAYIPSTTIEIYDFLILILQKTKNGRSAIVHNLTKLKDT